MSKLVLCCIDIISTDYPTGFMEWLAKGMVSQPVMLWLSWLSQISSLNLGQPKQTL